MDEIIPKNGEDGKDVPMPDWSKVPLWEPLRFLPELPDPHPYVKITERGAVEIGLKGTF